MEIDVTIPDSLMNPLKKKTKTKSWLEIINDALALYVWAIRQKEHGRKILSSKMDEEKLTELEMPSLNRVEVKE